jgi:5-methylcytosine-specific restriction protein A
MKSKIKTLKPKASPVKIGLDINNPGTKRVRGYTLQKIRNRILLRDTYTCRSCGRVSSDLEIDHIVPLYLGGQESDANRQSLCRECHQKKTDREEKARGKGGGG